MKSKKALGKGETLTILIIAIAISILLGGSLFKWLEAAEGKTDINICRTSVLVNSEVGGRTIGTLQPALQCPADFVEIISKQRNDESAKREIIGKIVKEMETCWYKMGAGDAALFSGPRWTALKFCLVCSEFTINKDIPTNEIYNYIVENKAENGDVYKDYFDTWYGDHNDLDETYWLKDFYFLEGNLEDAGIFYGELTPKEYSKAKYPKRPEFDINSQVKYRLNLLDELKTNIKYEVLYIQRWDSTIWGGITDLDYQTVIITPATSRINQKCKITYHETKRKLI